MYLFIVINSVNYNIEQNYSNFLAVCTEINREVNLIYIILLSDIMH